MKYMVAVLGLLWVTLTQSAGKSDLNTQKNEMQNPKEQKAYDSLKVSVNKRAVTADKKQESIIDGAEDLQAELNMWKRKYAARPVKIIYRSRECHADTIIKIEYQKVTRRQLRIINKIKQKSKK